VPPPPAEFVQALAEKLELHNVARLDLAAALTYERYSI
jgi:hypothetical protein